MSLPLVVLVSGSGTNLQAILDAIADQRLDAEVKLVLSNVAGALALDRAQKAGLPIQVLDHKQFPSRPYFDAELARVVRAALGDHAHTHTRAHGIVVLAGFMRLLGATFLDLFPRRVINIHPSLLPAFPGTHSQKRALEGGVRITGCTVHLVDTGTDTGPILAQAAVPVLDGDDEPKLVARILEKEHALLPGVLQWIAEGRLRFDDAGHPRFEGVSPALGLST